MMNRFQLVAKLLQIIAFVTYFLFLFGCVASGTNTPVTQDEGSTEIQQAPAEAYNGPKARIAVARFENKSGDKSWYSPGIGDGIAGQLTAALFNSNRFIVLEHQLDEVDTEQDLGTSGQDTAAQIKSAELLVVGAVTELQGDVSGGGMLGAITGGFKKAHVAIDFRIVDSRTSRVLAATSVEGESTDVNLDGEGGESIGGGALGETLSGWKNTPVEKALRACINNAVQFIVSKTPQRYYHYGTSSTPKSPTTMGASGVSRAVVREMQTILNSPGYDTGNMNASFQPEE